MSPLWLVGLLAFTLLNPTHADVKHVLEGSVHPPQCQCSQTQYHQNHAFAASYNNPVSEANTAINEAVPGSVPFWWINNSNSPFKKAYEQFKKCSVAGNCVSEVPTNSFQAQVVSQKQNQVPVDRQLNNNALNSNPFINGRVQGSSSSFGSTDQSTFSANGQTVNTADGFLGVQPNNPPVNTGGFSQVLENQRNKYENCNSAEYVCVEQSLCLNGVVQVFGQDLLDLRTKNNYCEVGKEVCCRLPNLSTPAHQSNAVDSYSVSKTSSFNSNYHGYANLSEYVKAQNAPGSLIKFGGNSGLSAGSIQVVTGEENGALVPAGSSNTNRVLFSTPNPNSLFQGTIDYSNVKFNQENFGSNFNGPQYLPPLPPAISTYKPSIPTNSRPISTSSYTFAPSTPKPFTVPSVSYTSRPSTFSQYVPPKSTPAPFTFPSTRYTYTTQYTTPKPRVTTYNPQPQPSQNINKVTEGYYYSTPTPTFGYPKTTQKPPTPGYQYEKPTPPFDAESSFQIQNQYQFPTQKTPGYSYPTPTPSVIYPSVSSSTVQKVTIGYIPPRTASTSGYDYPTPSPSFSLPSRTPAPTTRRPTSNTYLPPLNPNESINRPNIIVNPPTIKPPTKEYIPVPPTQVSDTKINQQFVNAGCAAALKCVPEEYCTAQGLISQTPVVLSKVQSSFRVPTTQCYNKETGVSGNCCRDPNYVDPWPSANLLNGEDDGQYREDPSLGQYSPERQRVVRSKNNDLLTSLPVPQKPKAKPIDENTCGIRHLNTVPEGRGPIDVNFAEIPWQAMILRDGNRSLLCGGVIVKRNAVLTAAHCVEGLETSDVLIKGGEWKLGIDEEPLPFQIAKVAAIVRHPEYIPGSYKNDLALLMLDENLNFAKNIAPICLQPPNQPLPQQCIVTGWGKRILQAHLRNSVMRAINVNVLDHNQCSDVISKGYKHVLQHFQPETMCVYSSNDQCDVDYGSAMACTNGNSQYTLAGIFSWDTGCKDKSQIGGYVVPDVEWIESITAQPLTHLKALDRKYRNH